MELYGPSSDRWEAVRDMSEPRYCLVVCVAGGWNNKMNLLSSTERYDPGTDSWEAVGALSQARTAVALVAL